MYGTGEKPTINGEGKVREVVFLHNQHHLEINNLRITHDDDFEMDQEEEPRAGVRISAKDAGAVSHIHLKNLFVLDVDGTYNEKKYGGIVFAVTGTSIETYYNDILVEAAI